MNPTILDKEKLLLAGVSVPLAPRSVPPVERFRAIPGLWQSLLGKLGSFPGRLGSERYAVIENDVRDNGAAPLYRAMVVVASFDNLPPGIDHFIVEPGRFAVFEHKGLARDLSKTVAMIHSTWASRIDGLFESDLEIFVYPAGYDPNSVEAKLAYWLPVRRNDESLP